MQIYDPFEWEMLSSAQLGWGWGARERDLAPWLGSRLQLGRVNVGEVDDSPSSYPLAFLPPHPGPNPFVGFLATTA